MLYCINCKFYQATPHEDGFYGRCKHEQAIVINPVSGETEYHFARVCRDWGPCWQEGRLYQESEGYLAAELKRDRDIEARQEQRQEMREHRYRDRGEEFEAESGARE